MTRYLTPFAAVLLFGCSSPLPPEVPPPPGAPSASVPLRLAYRVADSSPGAHSVPFGFVHITFSAGQLTISGRQPSGGLPTSIDSIAGMDFGDSVVLRVAARSGPFAAVSVRDYEVRAYGLTDRPRWVRVYGCFRSNCYLAADTVFGAPFPGQHPPGW